MVKVNYVGFGKAQAWDEALAMSEFRSKMIALGGKWRFGSVEHARYSRIARAIDDCANDWGFNASDLYGGLDGPLGSGSTGPRRNPFRQE